MKPSRRFFSIVRHFRFAGDVRDKAVALESFYLRIKKLDIIEAIRNIYL